jgi:hypothetical protein
VGFTVLVTAIAMAFSFRAPKNRISSIQFASKSNAKWIFCIRLVCA